MAPVMDKERKLELIQRSLALQHKIKVHDSVPRSDTHEELALSRWARWELEDELHAIESILRDARAESVAAKVAEIRKTGVKRKSKKA
jgi:hypothetical protein